MKSLQSIESSWRRRHQTVNSLQRGEINTPIILDRVHHDYANGVRDNAKQLILPDWMCTNVDLSRGVNFRNI